MVVESLPSFQGMEKLPVEFLPGKKAEQTRFKPAIPKAEPIKRKTHASWNREAGNKEDEDRGLPRKRSLFLVHLRFIYNVKQNVLADC